MRLPSIFRLRLRSLIARGEVEQELDEELRYHLERQIDEYVAAGMTPEEARFAALRALGRIEQSKEECRDERGLNVVDTAVHDLRYAVRQLRRSPGFTATATFVLGLGICAAVSIFGLVEAALIRPLPYADQAGLVGVFESGPGWPQGPVSYQNFGDWQKLNRVFRSIDAYALNGGFTMSTPAGAEPVTGTRISPGFFRTLGVVPVMGRGVLPAEDSVLLSYSAWKKRFLGRADVVGRSVTLNGVSRTIVGVLPREFHFAPAGASDFWAPLRNTDPCERERGCHNLNTVARLKDGVSSETASAAMNVIARQLQKQYPDSNRDIGAATLVPLRDVIVGDVRPILLMLFCGAGVLLLIAYVNVTTLLLARSDSRRREIAVRGSLGATSARLFHLFAVEGFVLAAAGGVLGFVLSEWGMRILAWLVPAQKMDSMPYLRTLGSDLHTVVFASCLTLLAGLLFALVPMLRVPLSETAEGLKDCSRGSAGMTWRRFGSNLVVVEMALAMVLMTGAGLLGKSLYELLKVDTGLQPDHLGSVGLIWPPAHYTSDEAKVALGRRIIEKVSALPGVKSTAIGLTAPVGPAWGTASFHVNGRPNYRENNEVLRRQVSAGYFKTLGARLIRGRYFDAAEDAAKPRVAIVNRSLAQKYFAGEDPLGKRVYWDWASESPIEVVGIVEDIKEGPVEGADLPALYTPFDQAPVAWFAILVRTAPREQSVLTAIPAAIHEIDRDISVSEPETMTQRIHNSPAAYIHRSSAWLVGSFAALAFLLGIVGLYGVVSYSISHRTREIGVRMALGAGPVSVLRLIVGEASRLALAGTILGLGGSLAAATFLRGVFYRLHAWDFPVLASVFAALFLAALLASYIPARRAASLNPVEALHSE